MEPPPSTYLEVRSIEVTFFILSLTNSTYQTTCWSAVPYQEEDFRFKAEEDDGISSILMGKFQDYDVAVENGLADNIDLDEYLVF